MKKLILIFSLCFSTVGLAEHDPSWFNRREATSVSWQLQNMYDHFTNEVLWVVGRGHPLYRITEHAEHEVSDVAQDLANYVPFSQMYERERHYYRVTWPQLQREFVRANLRSPYLHSMYQDITGLSDRLHRLFNANPPVQWRGYCRIVLETIWGQDVRDYYGNSYASSQSEALNRARNQAWGTCEHDRNQSNLHRCVVDQNRCYAVRTLAEESVDSELN